MDFRKWIVIATADCDSVNWRDPYIIDKNSRSSRKSIDGTQTLISYNELLPNSINAISSKGNELDKAALNALMATDAWYVADELGD